MSQVTEVLQCETVYLSNLHWRDLIESFGYKFILYLTVLP